MNNSATYSNGKPGLTMDEVSKLYLELLEKRDELNARFIMSPAMGARFQELARPFEFPLKAGNLVDVPVYTTPHLPPDEKMLPRKWRKRIGGQAWRKPIICRQEVPSEKIYVINAPSLFEKRIAGWL